MIRDQVRGVYGIDEERGDLMRVYFRYAVKETLSNLWRNRMMTIAAVLTVAVSLSLVGSALLLKQSAAQASSQWQQGTRVTVWMQPNASAGEITNVQDPVETICRS
jgi:cell division transport system permease protein